MSVTLANPETLKMADAVKYLEVYLGPAPGGWQSHINKLWARGDNRGRPEQMRKLLSFAILIRAFHSNTRVDRTHPEDLLFMCHKFHQLDERDWFAAFQKVQVRDGEIKTWGEQALRLGVIDPPEYQPYTRQAFNWLCEYAEKAGALTPEAQEDVIKQLKAVVYRYGGVVVSNLFIKHKDKMEHLVNWNTSYFIERTIFDVYTIEQVLKIKEAEINDSAPALIKKI